MQVSWLEDRIKSLSHRLWISHLRGTAVSLLCFASNKTDQLSMEKYWHWTEAFEIIKLLCFHCTPLLPPAVWQGSNSVQKLSTVHYKFVSKLRLNSMLHLMTENLWRKMWFPNHILSSWRFTEVCSLYTFQNKNHSKLAFAKYTSVKQTTVGK